MPDTRQYSGSLSISERRIHCRQGVLFSCIEVGKNNGGIVLNVSQGGLALQTVTELIDDELPKIRFQLSRSQVWIEAKGRITWRSNSQRMAGVQFIDLPDEVRKEIQKWISSRSDARRLGEETAPSEKTGDGTLLGPIRIVDLFPENRGQQPVPSLTPLGAAENSFSKTVRPIGLSLAALLLLSPFVFLSYYLHKIRNGHSSSTESTKSQLQRASPQKAEVAASRSAKLRDSDSPKPSIAVSKVHGNAEVKLELARKYLRAGSRADHKAAAVKLLWSAIENGNREAELQLAYVYLRGEGVPKNCEQTRILLRAEQNRSEMTVPPDLQELLDRECQ